jgi:two-component system phosphate regulon sensor histidine kinase PhoR
MPSTVVPTTIPRLLGGSLVLALGVLLTVLAAFDVIAWASAGIGVGAAVAAALIATATYRRDVSDVASYLQSLGEADRSVPFPPGMSPTARLLGASAARLHAEWRQRDERFRAGIEANEQVLEALHDPLILIASDRRVTLANMAARGLFGERMTDRDLAATLRNPHLLGAVDAVMTGGASRMVEFTLPVPVERVFEARVKPFRRGGSVGGGSGGGTGGTIIILTLHDITAIKRSEQMRADFVANASHELRTPLATLLGFIETLRGPARDDAEARDRFLGIMHEQSRRMSRLVNDLLSLSKIELDEHTTPTGQADLARIARSAVAALELKAASRKIKLVLDAPASLPLVTGDEDQLTQVLQNLIDNAVKYTRDNTEVRVTLTPVPAASPAAAGGRRPAPMVSASVADRGEGIDRTHLPRLTERFYRVDAARSRALGGTGLGLAIVKHIVNRHRGRLTIESEVGVGSTFTVSLPAAVSVEEGAQVPRTAGSAA